MAKKRKPSYLKILEGMSCCYGSSDRNCAECPYDKYNDRDFYGQGTSYCMEKLNADAKKWTESMEMFCFCKDCINWHKDLDEYGEWRFGEKFTDGYCSNWQTMTLETEYCSRGGMKE